MSHLQHAVLHRRRGSMWLGYLTWTSRPVRWLDTCGLKATRSARPVIEAHHQRRLTIAEVLGVNDDLIQSRRCVV